MIDRTPVILRSDFKNGAKALSHGDYQDVPDCVDKFKYYSCAYSLALLKKAGVYKRGDPIPRRPNEEVIAYARHVRNPVCPSIDRVLDFCEKTGIDFETALALGTLIINGVKRRLRKVEDYPFLEVFKKIVPQENGSEEADVVIVTPSVLGVEEVPANCEVTVLLETDNNVDHVVAHNQVPIETPDVSLTKAGLIEDNGVIIPAPEKKCWVDMTTDEMAVAVAAAGKQLLSGLGMTQSVWDARQKLLGLSLAGHDRFCADKSNDSCMSTIIADMDHFPLDARISTGTHLYVGDRAQVDLKLIESIKHNGVVAAIHPLEDVYANAHPDGRTGNILANGREAFELHNWFVLPSDGNDYVVKYGALKKGTVDQFEFNFSRKTRVYPAIKFRVDDIENMWDYAGKGTLLADGRLYLTTVDRYDMVAAPLYDGFRVEMARVLAKSIACNYGHKKPNVTYVADSSNLSYIALRDDPKLTAATDDILARCGGSDPERTYINHDVVLRPEGMEGCYYGSVDSIMFVSTSGKQFKINCSANVFPPIRAEASGTSVLSLDAIAMNHKVPYHSLYLLDKFGYKDWTVLRPFAKSYIVRRNNIVDRYNVKGFETVWGPDMVAKYFPASESFIYKANDGRFLDDVGDIIEYAEVKIGGFAGPGF